MKKILTLLLGIVAAIPALCQFPDTTQLGKRLVPTSYESVYIDHIPVQYEKTIDKFLNTGGLINYIVGTGNAHPNTMVRVLATQIAMNADVKPEELIMLQNFINELVKPGIYTPTPGNPPPDPPVMIEAESATSIVNAAIVGTIIGNMRGDLPGGVVIKYPPVGVRTKVRFRYSRGYTGSGNMVMKIGTTSNTLIFPSTGAWGTYQEIEFNVSGSGEVELRSSEIGACNYDWITFL